MLGERARLFRQYVVQPEPSGTALLNIGEQFDIRYPSVEAAESARKKLIAATITQRESDRMRGLICR